MACRNARQIAPDREPQQQPREATGRPGRAPALPVPRRRRGDDPLSCPEQSAPAKRIAPPLGLGRRRKTEARRDRPRGHPDEADRVRRRPRSGAGAIFPKGATWQAARVWFSEGTLRAFGTQGDTGVGYPAVSEVTHCRLCTPGASAGGARPRAGTPTSTGGRRRHGRGRTAGAARPRRAMMRPNASPFGDSTLSIQL